MTKSKNIKSNKDIKPLRREFDGTIYAYRCNECGNAWKVYQNPWHDASCSNFKKLKSK